MLPGAPEPTPSIPAPVAAPSNPVEVSQPPPPAAAAAVASAGSADDDWGNFGEPGATPASVVPTPISAALPTAALPTATMAASNDGDDWGDFGESTAPAEPTTTKKDVPEVRSSDSKWGAFDAMLSGAPEPTPSIPAPLAAPSNPVEVSQPPPPPAAAPAPAVASADST